MRLHLFEFEDIAWFPDIIRKGGTDYLRYFLNATGFYEPVIPLLKDLLNHSGSETVIDLCSGGGGNIEFISKKINEQNAAATIILTDKFPNLDAFEYISRRNAHIKFEVHSVDASNVPSALSGVRTMFSAAHHFKPSALKSILDNAVQNKVPIALFDGGDKNFIMIIGLLIVHPLVFFIFTPFFRPFKISRLIFTYLIPLIPIMTIWDGAVSIIRLYQPKDLLTLARTKNSENYAWQAGKKRNKWGFKITYLIGYPKI